MLQLPEQLRSVVEKNSDIEKKKSIRIRLADRWFPGDTATIASQLQLPEQLHSAVEKNSSIRH